MTRGYHIARLGGDGIGPEVIQAASKVLDCLPINIIWEDGEVGFSAWQKYGDSLPARTLELALRSEAVLFGAVTTPPDIAGYRSPILRLRTALDLYANVRACRSIPHPSSRTGINLVVIRENTEGAYAGRERLEDDGETARGEIFITRNASRRITRFACQHARTNGYSRVTVVHKANVLRETSGLFRRTALEAGGEYPGLTVDEMLVDSCAMALIREPELFGVIVTTNLFGDILSDEASMLTGGLGVAASANIGDRFALFEPIHGSAPGLAGSGQANPVAAILSAALMLEHLGEINLGALIRSAVDFTLNSAQVTPDLGGHLTTEQATAAIIEQIRRML